MIYPDILDNSKNRNIKKTNITILSLPDRHIPNEQQFSFHKDMVVENQHDMLILYLIFHLRKTFEMVIHYDLFVDLFD
jgi:hypothetical protein